RALSKMPNVQPTLMVKFVQKVRTRRRRVQGMVEAANGGDSLLVGGGTLLSVSIDAEPPDLRFQRLPWYSKFAAAPDGPDIRPCVSARAASIISTSRSASAESPSCDPSVSAGSHFSQLSSTRKVSVSQRTTANSTTFCNSRIFPGQV